MPFRGILNGIFGGDTTADIGQQQAQGGIVRSQESDSFSFANQLGQQQQVSSQELLQRITLQQQAEANRQYTQSSLYELVQQYTQSIFYGGAITFDTSNETTRSMCAVIRKASEGLKATVKVKESV